MTRKHWVETKLQDIAEIIMGQSPPSSSYNGEKIGLPFFQGKAEFGDVSPVAVKYCTEPTRIAEPNDILLSIRAPVGPTNLADTKCCIGRGLAMIRPRVGCELIFLYQYFKHIEPWLSKEGTGSTFTAINKDVLHELPFPLPPLNEQKRIVEKLDAILPKVKSAKARLEKIPHLLKKFRQSVLAAACSGKLTENWREGKDLPEWYETNIGSVIDSLAYGTSKKCDYQVENGMPVLRIPNVSSGKLDLSDLKHACLNLSEIEKYSLKIGDLLVIRSNGSVSLLGQSVFIDETANGFAYAGYLIRLRCSKEKLTSKYLNFALKTNDSRSQIELPARSTTGVHNINSNEIKSLIFPLPPLEEQHEIVRRVEKLFTVADSLETKYQKAMEKIAKLEQAILAKAFCGELVEPDPNDEPAAELLKRIVAEKSQLKISKKQP